MNPKTLGALLKKSRKVKGYSEQDLAQRLHVTVFEIQDIEAGKKPVSIDYICKLKKHFELSDKRTIALIKDASASHKKFQTLALNQKQSYAYMLLQYHLKVNGDNPKLDALIEFMENT